MHAPTRHRTIDGLRGVAVLGILAMNIVGFAMPDGAYWNPVAYGANGPADIAAWALSFVLVEGKMRGLFSLLFGASMLLVADGAEARGENPTLRHYRRMIVLALFGAAHLYLIWGGDILLHYALVGSIAFLFRHKPPIKLAALAASLFLAQAMLAGGSVAGLVRMQAAALSPEASAAAVRTWTDMRNIIGVPSPGDLAADLALFRGPWRGIVAHLTADGLRTPLSYLLAYGVETLALMLAGMAALRTGFLTGGWDRSAYRRVALWGYAIGLPGEAALAWWCGRSGFDSLTVFAVAYLWTMPFRLAVTTAHAALAILWLAGSRGWLAERFVAAGRVAFTNYLATSLATTALFYGWGFGLFGHVGRAQLYLVVAGWWVVMLAWPKPWLARFTQGPLEWLWRGLAQGRFPPLARRGAAPDR